MQDLKAIFTKAYEQIQTDFSTIDVAPNLQKVTVALSAHSQKTSRLATDQYRARSRVPAHYNPNNHTIYLNTSILKKISPKTVYNICYHELIHAISLHQTWSEPETKVFQSGVKVETYYQSQYNCSHRALNEGIVQFLTNTKTGANEPAYRQEVLLVSQIASKLGSDLLEQALLSGNRSALEDKFNETYGAGNFERFSHYLDAKSYLKAAHIIA